MEEIRDKWISEAISSLNNKISEFKKDYNCLQIINKDEKYSCGCWYKFINSPNKQIMHIKVDCNKKGSYGKIYCTVIQYDKDGNEYAGDYLVKKEGFYEGNIKILKETDKIKIELLFYSKGIATATFSYPEIIFKDEEKHRIVNVATAYFRRPFEVRDNGNIEKIIEIIDNASKDKNKPDILCFTETAFDRGILGDKNKMILPPESPYIKRVLDKAKEHKMYIIFSLKEKIGKNYCNTNLLISDEGKIVGKYNKTHLCYGEVRNGMIPGEELPVFDLPFGKIGMLICWDQWFPESARELVSKGAEIIFISTAGSPEDLSCARAHENNTYIVVAGCADEGPDTSFVINKDGKIIGCVEDEEKGYISVPIDLDDKSYTRWLSFERGRGKELYKQDRRNDLYTYNKEER